MERIVGEDVDGVERRVYAAVEEQLGAEEDAVEGHDIGLEMVVVDIVELGSLGKEIK